ncbi:MAG: hypothetical protein PVJ69_02490 [Desulfobacteraceae bacterium]
MQFCDLNCRYANWPQDEGADGSGSCRTFQAIFCEKKDRLVHKNAPCPDKEITHHRDKEDTESV